LQNLQLPRVITVGNKTGISSEFLDFEKSRFFASGSGEKFSHPPKLSYLK
jgi:hypothetical protein